MGDTKRIVDITAVLAETAKRAHLSLQTVNEVQLIRLEAEIKLGQELIKAKEAKSLREGRPEKIILSEDSFRLSDYAISLNLSSRAQAFAKAEKEILRIVIAPRRTPSGELPIMLQFSREGFDATGALRLGFGSLDRRLSRSALGNCLKRFDELGSNAFLARWSIVLLGLSEDNDSFLRSRQPTR